MRNRHRVINSASNKTELLVEAIENINSAQLRLESIIGQKFNDLDVSYMTLIKECLVDDNNEVFKMKVNSLFAFIKTEPNLNNIIIYDNLSILLNISDYILDISKNYNTIERETTKMVRLKLDGLASLMKINIIDTICHINK